MSGGFYTNSDHAELLESKQTAPGRPTALSGDDQGKRPFFDHSAHAGNGDKPEDSSRDASINLPENIKRLREESASPYDAASTYRGVLGEPGQLTAVLPDAPAEVRTEVAHIFADHSLSASEAEEVVNAMRAAPTDETRTAWTRETNEYLNSVPPEDAAAAVTLLDRDPRVAKILEQTGAINNPRVVKLLVEKARSLRARVQP